MEWQRVRRVAAVMPGTQPMIERRKVMRRLIDDGASWELPPAWKCALASEVDGDGGERRERMERVTV